MLSSADKIVVIINIGFPFEVPCYVASKEADRVYSKALGIRTNKDAKRGIRGGSDVSFKPAAPDSISRGHVDDRANHVQET